MELSNEVHNLWHRFKALSQLNDESSEYERPTKDVLFSDNDLIQVSQIDFGSDDSWLHKPVVSKPSVVDLHKWLYEDFYLPKDLEFHSNHLSLIREISKMNTKKSIDTRTFTRPKKKLNRPSIDAYNEELFQRSSVSDSLLKDVDSFKSLPEMNVEEASTSFSENEPSSILGKPLQFDLSQPISINVFDNILSRSKGFDSFQNMSPPSLVNSMCSSTFTNPMENSYIKMELPESNNVDYSEQVLLQDSEPSLFQSFTESCSSLNSDTSENLRRKTLSSFNGTFRKNSSKDVYKSLNNSDSIECQNIYKNDSFEQFDCFDNSFGSGNESLNNTIILQQTTDVSSENIDPNTTIHISNRNNSTLKNSKLNLNATYENIMDQNNDKVSNELNSTFSKEPLNETFQVAFNINNLNSTYQKPQQDDSTLKENDAIDSIVNCDEFLIKKRLSYSIEDSLIKMRLRNEQLNSSNDLKRNSVGYPAGSADSLDRISSLSNSSRGSNRMLNMAEVDAIVEMQEKSLQIMSTPKPAKSLSKLWENEVISPISQIQDKEYLSETDSVDEYGTVSSGVSVYSEKGNLNFEKLTKARNNEVIASNPRSINTLTKGVSSIQKYGDIKGSFTNLKNIATNLKGSTTNLKTMNPNLKGSYTNLKPVGTNLPHAPAPRVPSSASNLLTRTSNQNYNQTPNTEPNFKMPLKQENSGQIKNTGSNNTFVKAVPRVSGLPRPISTGIPRPISKIPGPRSATSRSTVRSTAKCNYNDF